MHVDCLPCYFRQAYQAALFSGGDEARHWDAVRAVASYIMDINPGDDSIDFAERMHNRIKEALGSDDPYRKVKEEYTEMAEGIEGLIESVAAAGGDSLLSAVKVAIAGNVIDFGAGGSFDVESAISGALEYEFAIDHYDAFKAAFARAESVLYIGDNTGEIYFDKPLLRLLKGKEVTFVARDSPVLNDATIEYAERAGLSEFARLTDTGVSAPGFPPKRVRPEVRAKFESVDMVISKGQGNFESLCDHVRPDMFFLMKTKCELVSRLLGTNLGDIVLMESGRVNLNE